MYEVALGLSVLCYIAVLAYYCAILHSAFSIR